MVGVVEVKTLEKLASPFIKLGLLRKGDAPRAAKLLRPSGPYIDRGLKLPGLPYRPKGSPEEPRPEPPSILAARAAAELALALFLAAAALAAAEAALDMEPPPLPPFDLSSFAKLAEAKLFMSEAKSIPELAEVAPPPPPLLDPPSFLLAGDCPVSAERLARLKELSSGLFMPMPLSRLAKEDMDGLVALEEALEIACEELVVVLVPLVLPAELLPVCAAAAAASRNIFIEGKPERPVENMELPRPLCSKLENCELEKAEAAAAEAAAEAAAADLLFELPPEPAPPKAALGQLASKAAAADCCCCCCALLAADEEPPPEAAAMLERLFSRWEAAFRLGRLDAEEDAAPEDRLSLVRVRMEPLELEDIDVYIKERTISQSTGSL